MKYTPETGFLYSSRIITDSVQETRFLCTTSTPESLLLKGGGDTPQENLLRMLTRKSDRSFNQYR